MMPSIYQNAYKTNGISIILECQIDVINNNSMRPMPSQHETEPDRDPVLQSQKVKILIRIIKEKCTLFECRQNIEILTELLTKCVERNKERNEERKKETKKERQKERKK